MKKLIKYIVGKNYTDCRTKQKEINDNNLINSDDYIMFTFVTKPIHIKATGNLNDYYFTDNAYENNFFNEIINKIDYSTLMNNEINKSLSAEPVSITDNIDQVIEEDEITVPVNDDTIDVNDAVNDDNIDEITDDNEDYIDENDMINEFNYNEEVIEDEIKPTDPPRGWHLRKEYVDHDGNVYNKGEYQYNVKDEEI